MSKVSFVFTGDIGFDRYMQGKWDDPRLLSEKIVDFCKSSDHVIANVEGAVVDPDNVESADREGLFCHYMEPGAIKVLEKIRADIWNIANNHIMDMGEAGLKSTINYAQQSGSTVIGAGNNMEEASSPLYFEEAGGIGIISVGFICECPAATDTKGGCFTNINVDLIEKRIKEIKKTCRWCIVISHDGEEFTNLPNPYTRERYLEYLDMGADIIVAHHPHIPMNYELLGEKAIFYSLGNFIFDTDYQRAQHNTDKGVLLKLDLTEEEFTFEALGIRIVRGEERVVEAELPEIFADVDAQEYEKLVPLSAKAFVEAEKARNIFMNPQKHQGFTDKDWEEFLLSTDREEYIKGMTMDFAEILPVAQKAEEGKWKESKLEKIKEYILKQL